MKKALIAIVALVAMLVGCKTSFPVAQQTGKEDMAFLVFTGPNETYKNGKLPVQVDVDGTKFVLKNLTKQWTGLMILATVYQKQLMLSSQETKVIQLP